MMSLPLLQTGETNNLQHSAKIGRVVSLFFMKAFHQNLLGKFFPIFHGKFLNEGEDGLIENKKQAIKKKPADFLEQR